MSTPPNDGPQGHGHSQPGPGTPPPPPSAPSPGAAEYPQYPQQGYPQQPGQPPQAGYAPQGYAPAYPGPGYGAPPAYGTLKTLTIVSLVIVAVLSILMIALIGWMTSGLGGAVFDFVGGDGTATGMRVFTVLICLVAIGCYIAVIIGIGKAASWGRVLGLVSCFIGTGLIGILTLLMIIGGMTEGFGGFIVSFIVTGILFGPFLVVNAFWLRTAFKPEVAAYFR